MKGTAIKLAAFVPVRAEDIKASWSQLVALIGLGLGAMFLAEVAAVGRRGQLVIDGVPGALRRAVQQRRGEQFVDGAGVGRGGVQRYRQPEFGHRDGRVADGHHAQPGRQP